MMTMDQPEESQKEEQQEDNSKDEKVEMRLLSTHDHLFSTICKRDQIRTVDKSRLAKKLGRLDKMAQDEVLSVLQKMFAP